MSENWIRELGSKMGDGLVAGIREKHERKRLEKERDEREERREFENAKNKLLELKTEGEKARSFSEIKSVVSEYEYLIYLKVKFGSNNGDMISECDRYLVSRRITPKNN